MTLTTSCISRGRLGNQIIRNLAVSLIARKYDLQVDYSSKDLINKLGIELFSGKNRYDHTISLTDDNYFHIYNRWSNNNLDPNNNFFQTKEITNFLYEYIHTEIVKSNIIEKNPFKERYNSNNDLLVHIRLDDVAYLNPGITYYKKTIEKIEFEKLYITTDEVNHHFIKTLVETYPTATVIQYDEIKTFQFASTCKNIILSHGSFSAIIGYLAFFSNIYYPEFEQGKIWYGDIFSIPGWNKCSIT